ncbi:GNAT family N-acetyltransferase [Aquibaculum sediminis]|uniref:GNAT family N-acetyltransferase n=1 Tax=Aquibaculum sediminis TaxID=3231907 RepID=UPI003453BA4A
MAPTNPISITLLGEGHLPQMMVLSREAGWNQQEADWRLFLTEGLVFGALDDGGVVGSAAILPYGEDIAWISMVLVRRSHRKRGLGSLLLQRCLDELDRRRRIACLDATPIGEPLYRSLGFEGSLRLTRWQGEGNGPVTPPGESSPVPLSRSVALNAAVALDAAAFGAERRPILTSFSARLPTAAWMTQDERGAVLGRPGDRASQVGPLLAADEQTAIALLTAALAQLPGPVFIDVLDQRRAVAEFLRARGFTPQRSFLRMIRNASRTLGDIARLHAIAGPEFG